MHISSVSATSSCVSVPDVSVSVNVELVCAETPAERAMRVDSAVATNVTLTVLLPESKRLLFADACVTNESFLIEIVIPGADELVRFTIIDIVYSFPSSNGYATHNNSEFSPAISPPVRDTEGVAPVVQSTRVPLVLRVAHSVKAGNTIGDPPDVGLICTQKESKSASGVMGMR